MSARSRRPRRQQPPSQLFERHPNPDLSRRLLEPAAEHVILNADVWRAVHDTVGKVFPDFVDVFAEAHATAQVLHDAGLEKRAEHADMAMRHRLIQVAYAIGVLVGRKLEADRADEVLSTLQHSLATWSRSIKSSVEVVEDALDDVQSRALWGLRARKQA